MTETPDPTGTAWHEAGHAVAAWTLLQLLPSTVSVEPGSGFHGVTILGPRSIDFSGHHPDEPACLARPGLRFAVETEIIIALAGREAEDLAAPRLGRVPDPPEVALMARARLTAAELADLEEAEAIPPAEDPLNDPAADDAIAFALAARFAGSRCGQYLALCRAEARDLLIRNAEPVARLAAALLERRILARSDVAAILAEAPLAE